MVCEQVAVLRAGGSKEAGTGVLDTFDGDVVLVFKHFLYFDILVLPF